MGFHCANCGGNVQFDVASQSMKCMHCGSLFSPDIYEVHDRSQKEAGPEEGLSLFACGSCGAERQGTEDSQVGFCPYCGGQSLLKTSRDGGELPEKLIPFQISREQCADLFQKHTRRIRYLPKELKDAAHLKSFTGIYMPYYEYDVELGASHIKGSKVVKSTSRYEIVNTYQIDAAVDGCYRGVPFDASRYLDDEIAARTLPFDMKKERPFRPAYLSGFYADASTVPAGTYYKEAADAASSDVIDEVAERVLLSDQIKVEKTESSVESRTTGYHASLLPLWFLTWRKDDRVAYAVVNGESGRIVTDLPVDLKAFFLGCGLVSILCFLVLELLFQPTPLITSVASLFGGMLMAGSIRGSTRQILEKQTHAHDKGWNSASDQASISVQQTGSQVKPTGSLARQAGSAAAGAEPGKKKKTAEGGAAVLGLSIPVLISLYTGFYTLTSGGSRGYSFVMAASAVIYVLVAALGVFRWQKEIPERQPTRAILPVIGAVILNALIIVISPVNDIWYYLGDAACILILIAASFQMLEVYNIGTMRPLPKLFDRKEVK